MAHLLFSSLEDLLEGFFKGTQVQVKGAHIASYGVGGSGIALRLMKDLFPALPFRLLNFSEIPPPQHFTILVSYSGNTTEVLQMAQSLKNHTSLCVVSSGGALSKWAQKREIPLVLVPQGFLPRFALYHLLGVLCGICRSFEPQISAERVQSIIMELQKQYSANVQKGEILAEEWQKLGKKIPAIWGVEGISGSVAYRWRTQVNENAKIPALSHQLPESAHNELQALSPDAFPIFLASLFDPPLIERQREILKKILIKKGVPVQTITAKSKERFSALLSLILIGDVFSLRMAEILGKDPTATPLIKEFRQEMEKK